MSIGTIGHVGMRSSLFSSAVLHSLANQMRTKPLVIADTETSKIEIPVSSIAKNSLTPTNNQLLSGFKYTPQWLVDRNIMHFEELPTIDKEKFDVELMLAELKDGHDLMVKKTIDVLLNDSGLDKINEFTSWSNQYLAQLIYAVAARYLAGIDDLIDKVVDDERQKANYNDLWTIKNTLRDIFLYKVIALLKAQESANTYPISKEGVSLLKEFSKVVTRLENASKKINEFSKNKLRPQNVSL